MDQDQNQNPQPQDDGMQQDQPQAEGEQLAPEQDQQKEQAAPTDGQPATSDVEITEPEPGFFIKTVPGSKYIIEYHRDMCISAGSCAAIGPNTFKMDDENKAIMINGESGPDSDENVLAAAQSCPVMAIVIKDAQTGEQVYPMQ